MNQGSMTANMNHLRMMRQEQRLRAQRDRAHDRLDANWKVCKVVALFSASFNRSAVTSTVPLLFVGAVMAILMAATPATATSLWNGETVQASSLFVDKPAPTLAVNDIVVILIEERLSAASDINTEAKLDDTVDGSVKNWFSVENAADVFKLLTLQSPSDLKTAQNTETNMPEWGIQLKNKFKGEATTDRTNKVVTTIAAHVVAVRPNGTVILEGKRNVKVNKETTIMTVTGTARTKDISSNNTISSSLISDLMVSVDGKGIGTSVNRRGLVSYIMSWIR